MFGNLSGSQNTLAVKITGDSSSLKRAAGKATSSLASLRTAALGVTAAVAGVGAIMAGQAVNAATDFNQSMADLKAAANATNEEMDLMESKTKEVGKRTRFMAKDIAKAEKALAKSGFTAQQTTEAIDGVAAAAAASGEPIEQVGIQLTNVVKGYGMAAEETSKVADVFAEAARSSNTHINTLSKAMEYLGPVAKDMGLSIEKTTAMLGKLGDAGISAGKAGRQLRTAFLDFQSMESGKFSKPQQKALKRLGVNIKDVTSGKYSFEELITKLKNAGATAGDMSQIFTKRAATALMVLGDKSGEVDKLTNKLRESKGAADEMADTKLDTLKSQLDVLRGSVNLLFVELGQHLTPALKGMVKKTIGAVNAITSLVDGSKSLKQVFSPVLDAFRKFKQVLPPVIANNLRAIAKSLMVVGAAFAAYTLAPVIVTLGSALAGLASAAAPIAATIAGITAVLTVGQKIWNKFFGDLNPIISKFASVVGGIGISAIKETVQALKSGKLKKIPKIWKTAFQGIAKAAKTIWPKVKTEITEGLNDMYSAFKNQFPDLGKIIKEHAPGISKTFSGLVQSGKDMIAAFNKNILPKFKKVAKGIAGIFMTTGEDGESVNRLKELKKIVDRILGTLLDIVENTLDSIKGAFEVGEALFSGNWKKALIKLKDVVTPIFDSIKELYVSFGKNFKSALKIAGLWDNIKGGYKAVVDGIQNKLVEPIKDIPEKMKDIGKNVIEGIWTGLKEHLTGWFPKMIKNADIPGFLKGPLKKVLGISSPAKTMYGPGRAIVQGIGVGIEKELPNLMDKMDKVGQKVKDKIDEIVETSGYTTPQITGRAGGTTGGYGGIGAQPTAGGGSKAPGALDNVAQSSNSAAEAATKFKDKLKNVGNSMLDVANSLASVARSTGKLKPGEGAKISGMTGFASNALQGNWLQAGLSLFTGFMKARIEKLKAQAQELRKKIDAAFSVLQTGIQSFGNALNELAGDILGPFGSLLSGATSSLSDFLSMIKAFKMDNPMELIKAGFQGVMDVTMGVVKTFSNLIQKSEGMKALQERLKPVWQTIGNALGKLLMPLAALVDWATKFLGIATDVNDETQKMEEIGVPSGFKRERQVYAAAAPGQPMTGAGGETAIPSWAKEIIKPLKQYLRPILINIKEAGGIGKIISRWVKKVWQDFMPFITERMPAILNWIGKAINWLKNEVNWGAIWEGILSVAEFFWENFKPAWNEFTSNLPSLLNSLMGEKGLIGQLKSINKNLGAIAQNMGVASKTLAGAAGGAAAGAAVGSIVPGIGTGLGAIIGGGLGAIGGFMFQEGGIATEPTLGMVAESGPEAVIPLDKANQFGGSETIINIDPAVDDFVEITTNKMQKRNKEYTGSRSTGALQKRRVLT